MEIQEASPPHKPSLVLHSNWARLRWVLMEKDCLMVAFIMIGRPIDVDKLSIQKRDHEPIRMRFHCRYPEMIKGPVQVFVKGKGFMVGVQAEVAPRIALGVGTGGPSSPPHEDLDDDSYELSSDSKWNRDGRRGRTRTRSKPRMQVALRARRVPNRPRHHSWGCWRCRLLSPLTRWPRT
jgi:hypothetical protein